MKFKVLCFVSISLYAYVATGLAVEEALLTTTTADPFLQYTYDHQEIVKSVLTTPHDEMTQQAIRDRVRALRVERHEALPYLDR